MKIEQVMSLLEKSVPDYLYKVIVPSTGKEYTLKPMTVGMRKSISKFALMDSRESAMNFQFAKLGLIRVLSDGTITEKMVTEVDFVYLLCKIRQHNISERLMVTATCPHCKKSFDYSIDFDAIEKKLRSYVFTQESVDASVSDALKIKLVLHDPRMSDILDMRYALEQDSEKTEEEKDALYNLMHQYLYVKEIYVNDELLEDFSDKSIIDRTMFLEDLPGKSVYKESSGLFNTVIEKFKANNRTLSPLQMIKCAHCDADIEGGLDTDDFFIL